MLKVDRQLKKTSKSSLEVQLGNSPKRKNGLSERGKMAREAILQAAERIFAEDGINASLRKVMAEADVNVGAINYHFGTREDLLREMLERRVSIIVGERLTLLAEAESLNNPAELRDIVAALLTPTFRPDRWNDEGWRNYFKVQAHLRSQPSQKNYPISANLFAKQHQLFVEAIGRTLPDLGKTELFWRYYCLMSAMNQSVTNPYRIRELSGGRCDTRDSAAMMKAMIPALVGMLSAPPTMPVDD
ncbi:TetR family transcriptional regulator [Nitratireductor aestuarii]|uniref:TetR family transcriptional regulator n=1 Tax=Nitratireductor aestuarii TaxID=1735103 RepID=A0A916W8M4_9HYPH|nr:TetR family transcriptional regulator [Nitratireductor aestuarii]